MGRKFVIVSITPGAAVQVVGNLLYQKQITYSAGHSLQMGRAQEVLLYGMKTVSQHEVLLVVEAK